MRDPRRETSKTTEGADTAPNAKDNADPNIISEPTSDAPQTVKQAKPQVEASALATLAVLQAGFMKIAGSMVAMGGVVYVMGWMCARAYYGRFGAEWLSSEMTPLAILQFGAEPVLAFLVSLIFVLAQLEVDWPKNRLRVDFSIIIALWIVLPSLFGDLSCDAVVKRTADRLPIILAFCASLLVVWLAIRVREYGWKIPNLEYYALFLVFVGLPVAMGYTLAKRDLDPTRSKLARVNVPGDNEANLRLLRTRADLCFAVDLTPTAAGTFPPVRVLNLSEVTSIRGELPQLESKATSAPSDATTRLEATADSAHTQEAHSR
jgi:hypothetical protein